MKKKWYFIIVLIALVLMQFIRIDKTHPEINPTNDFINIKNPPPEIAQMIKTSCYDCHSFESKYPWYAEVAPVSWYLKNHINEARHRVNFSEWASYEPEKASRKLHACADDIKEGDMPLSSYTLIHGDASLNQEQIKQLSEWFELQASAGNN